MTTIKELKKFIEDMPDDTEVRMFSDSMFTEDIDLKATDYKYDDEDNLFEIVFFVD